MAGIERRDDVEGARGWTDLRLARLTRLRNALAGEISVASERGAHEVMGALVRARDAMNDALTAAGDREAARCNSRYAALDEMSGGRASP